MADDQDRTQQSTDHLGRETGTPATSARTVTEFAVEQGTVDADDVQEALEDEQRRAEQGAERARVVSERMAPAPASTQESTDDAEDDAEDDGSR